MGDRFFITSTAELAVDTTASYNLWLVALAYIIACFASYTALRLAGMLRTAENECQRQSLNLAGAGALGCGIWAMHFIAMLAYETQMLLRYNILITLLSLIISVLCAYGAFSVVRKGYLCTRTLILSSIILGIGITSMHYTGMSAMEMDATLHYTPALFMLSILIGIGASAAALLLFFHLSRLPQKYQRPAYIACAMIMGLAISGLHYTGMAAANFIPFADCRYTTDQSFLGLGLAVTAVSTSIIGGALFVSLSDRKKSGGESIYHVYRQYFPPFLAILVGLCLAIYSGTFLNLQNTEKLKSEAFLLSRDLMRQIERMAENIIDLEAFYNSSDYVDENEFKSFLNVYINRNKYLEAYYFVPLSNSEFRALSRNNETALDQRNFESLLPLLKATRAKQDTIMVSLEAVGSMPLNVRRDYMAIVSMGDIGPKKMSGYFVALINKKTMLDNFSQMVRRRGLTVDVELVGIDTVSRSKKLIDPQFIENSFIVSSMQWRLYYQSGKLPFITNPIDFFIPFSILLISILIAVYTHLLLAQRLKDEKAKVELLRARDIADRANATKSDFLANMSHEIRSPMNSVLGITEMLLKTDLTAEQRSWAEIVRKSGEGLLNIINDILDFSKMEAEKLVLESVPFNLVETLTDVTDISSLPAQEKNLDLLISIAPGTPRCIKGDPARFRQVLLNFVSNAIKFTNKGHVLIRASSFRRVNDGVLELRIDVEDTGIGIPEDKIAYVFEKFTQAEESTSRRFGGTGLGLAICRGLVELMHGRVELTSKQGQGSTFSVTIPVEIATYKATPYHPEISLETRSVLVIEPYPAARDNLETTVRQCGPQCTTSDTLENALTHIAGAKANGSGFDFILLDYGIAVEDGGNAVETLLGKSGDGKKPYIFLTGGVGATSSSSLLDRIGVGGYLSKPIVPPHTEIAFKMALSAKEKLFISRTLIDSVLYAENYNKAGTHDKPNYAGKRLLIVDDMKVNQMIMNKVLEDYGCIVDFANNGHDALAMIASQPYDLVFMDCQMPEMDGFEATRIIRTQSTSTPEKPVIIALTADAMTGDREKCLNAGMNDYLNKPFKAEQIGDMLRKWLA